MSEPTLSPADAGQLAETHSVSIRGTHVRIRVQGRGEPLLLINGTARPMESWEPLVRALPGRTLVSFDAPGVGLSTTPPRPPSIPALARIAASVLDEAGLASADILGVSFGGAPNSSPLSTRVRCTA